MLSSHGEGDCLLVEQLMPELFTDELDDIQVIRKARPVGRVSVH